MKTINLIYFVFIFISSLSRFFSARRRMLMCKPNGGSATVFIFIGGAQGTAQGTVRVDARTMRVGNEDAGPVEHVNGPFDDGVRPVRGRRERLADGAARELQVAQDGLDVGFWCGRRDARPTDFRHC